MTTSPKGTPDVSAHIFEVFLQNLEQADVPDTLITQLRKTLLEDKIFTERALKNAVIPEKSST